VSFGVSFIAAQVEPDRRTLDVGDDMNCRCVLKVYRDLELGCTGYVVPAGWPDIRLLLLSISGSGSGRNVEQHRILQPDILLSVLWQ